MNISAIIKLIFSRNDPYTPQGHRHLRRLLCKRIRDFPFEPDLYKRNIDTPQLPLEFSWTFRLVMEENIVPSRYPYEHDYVLF
jgi:hypothetical protein